MLPVDWEAAEENLAKPRLGRTGRTEPTDFYEDFLDVFGTFGGVAETGNERLDRALWHVRDVRSTWGFDPETDSCAPRLRILLAAALITVEYLGGFSVRVGEPGGVADSGPQLPRAPVRDVSLREGGRRGDARLSDGTSRATGGAGVQARSGEPCRDRGRAATASWPLRS